MSWDTAGICGWDKFVAEIFEVQVDCYTGLSKPRAAF